MPSEFQNNNNPDLFLYEYAVIRYCPDVEREEFLNIGLIMMCKRKRWIKVETSISRSHISSIFPETDFETLENQIAGFSQTARGISGTPQALIEVHERFRWLTAVKSACITTSRPHPGKCSNLDKEFDKLYQKLVCRLSDAAKPS